MPRASAPGRLNPPVPAERTRPSQPATTVNDVLQHRHSTVAYPAREVPSDIPSLVAIVEIVSRRRFKLAAVGDGRYEIATRWWQRRHPEPPSCLARAPNQYWYVEHGTGGRYTGPMVCAVSESGTTH